MHMLRVRTDRLRRLDEVLGGGDTFRVYLGEYQATKSLLRTCSFTEESRRCLLSLLAEQSQQAGWAAFDGGEISQAASLYEESKGLALEAGDMDLLGNGLCFLAYQTLDRADAVHMATASCATINSATPSAVQALLHERMAWACALANQAEQSERALDAARTALDSAQDGEPQPDWAAWVDGTELDIMTGRCWAELRRPLRAVPVLKQALDAYSDHNARDKALYMSWLSDAYLMAGEVEEAARVAGRALDLASGVASVRPRMRLAPVLEQLGPHQSLGAVQEALGRAVRT
nr:XRE family transcriptional regulator [Streptomyces tsukubensis NRRL18488]